MATMSLAGCFGGDDNGASEEEPVETLDDWMVFSVDSGDDLPNCNSNSLGRLYYVANLNTFEVCLTTGWSFIDIKGADGAQGACLLYTTPRPRDRGWGRMPSSA